MTERPIVLLDCDGVLADFVGGYLREITDNIKLTDEEKRAVNDIVREPGFVLNLAVLDGAKAGVKALAKVSDLYIVTSPWNSRHWAGERQEWLCEHFKDLRLKKIVQTSAKHLVRGDFLVDDKASNCQAHGKAWPGSRPLLWDTIHNRLDTGIERVSSWDELLGRIKGETP